MIASDILAPVLPLIPVPRRAEALDNFDTHHHANALDTNSGTHRTGQPSNTLDIRDDTLDTQPSDTLDLQKLYQIPITNTNHHPADALVTPPPGCIGQANRATHWTCQLHWAHHHLSDAFDHDVLKPHVGPASRPLANVLPPRLVPRDPVGFEY